jgi:hypothetical protein
VRARVPVPELAGWCALACLLGGAPGCLGSSGPTGPSGGAREPGAEQCGEAARGDRSQLTTPIGAEAGPRIDDPKTCDDSSGTGPGAYIRVHGHGQRRFQMGRDACVFADDFGRAVIARLGAQGIQTIGLGLGVCGDIRGDYDAWNISVSILDWKHADAAIAAVDAELRARDAGHFFGISVRGIGCAVAE